MYLVPFHVLGTFSCTWYLFMYLVPFHVLCHKETVVGIHLSEIKRQ